MQVVLLPYLSDHLYMQIVVWKMKILNISRYGTMKRHDYMKKRIAVLVFRDFCLPSVK